MIFHLNLSNFKEVIILLLLIGLVKSHGRMDEPPSRNSAWRFLPGFPIDREDYNLAHSFGLAICGSLGHQYGGVFATGKIVKTYLQGDIINISTYIQINHGGSIQISACQVPNDFSNIEATQACFDKYKLEVVNVPILGNDKTKAKVFGTEKLSFNHSVKLPDDLYGRHIVLQWKWYAASTGEVFTNCADVEITFKPTTTKTTTTTKLKPNVIRRKPTSTNRPIISTALSITIPKAIKFSCYDSIPPSKSNSVSNRSFRYIGRIVICFRADKTIPFNCNICKESCLDESEECPEECDCRWYP